MHPKIGSILPAKSACVAKTDAKKKYVYDFAPGGILTNVLNIIIMRMIII